MATIEEGLIAYVEANVASAGKGYPMQVPQDAAYPAWSYQVTGDEQSLALDGPMAWYEARFSLSFLSVTYANSKAAANALRAALDGYRGAMGGKTVQFCKALVSDDWADLHDMPVARLEVTINYV